MPVQESVIIDGSFGEGGGQIVRSSLALSLVTRRPVVINNIRAGRPKPGLRHQHLAAIKAAAEVCGGVVQGAAVGSRSICFDPGTTIGRHYDFDVGTAGSTTLVLQSVLPALVLAEDPSTLVLRGGTHNPWAPPFDFLAKTYLPLLNRMGPDVSATLEEYGFYPAGGGRFRVSVRPAAKLSGFDLLERGRPRFEQVRAIVSRLPRQIAEREIRTVRAELAWPQSAGVVEEVAGHGPGNVVMIEYATQASSEIFAGFGRLRVRAEDVAREAVRQLREYMAADVPVGPFLADQLLLLLGISAWQKGNRERQCGGSFRTLPLTRHATTHVEILRQFLNIDVEVTESAATGTCTVQVRPGVQL
jgi:RNA 3'-terminal phosphate cyclase (ATP)